MSITYILHAIMYFLHLRYHRHYLFRDVVPYTILASHCLQVLSSQTRKQPYKTHEKFMSVKNKKIVNVTKSIGSILKIARNAKVLQRNRNMRRCTYVCSGMIFIFQIWNNLCSLVSHEQAYLLNICHNEKNFHFHFSILRGLISSFCSVLFQP